MDNQWQMAVDEQEVNKRNAILQRDLEAQRAMLADAENAARADAQEAAQNQIFMRNLMGTIVKQSGGRPISQRLANWANNSLQKMGVKDMGFLPGGGINGNGEMFIPTYKGVDANGSPVPSSGIKYSPTSLFGMMSQLRGIFDDGDRKGMADQMRNIGIGDDVISSISSKYNQESNPASARNDPDFIGNKLGADGRTIGNGATFKGADTRPRGIHVFSADGRGGFSRSDWTPENGMTREDFGTRDPNYKGKWKVLESGPDGKRYENDKTGDVVFVKNGENPPWVNGGTSDKQLDRENKLEIARLQDQGKTDRANARNESRMSVEEIKAELKRQGYEIDEKKFEESVRHNKATEKLGEGKLEHNKNRLENDKDNERADREARSKENRFKAAMEAKKTELKSIDETIKATPYGEERDKLKQSRDKIIEDMNRLSDEYDKATMKPGDNNRRKVTVGEIITKDGVRYEVVPGKDGKGALRPVK